MLKHNQFNSLINWPFNVGIFLSVTIISLFI